jgi:hypothetical protein
MDQREKQIRQKLKDDFVHYASKCLKIRTKSGEIMPFLLNQGQKHIHSSIEDQRRKTGKVRVIVCKGRQLGSSTYASGRMYHNVTHHYGVRAFILTHEKDATDNLFEMSQRFHDNVPSIVKPQVGVSSAKELYFDLLDSGYKIGTAGNKATGRSSTIQYLLGSEVAHWPNAAEHAKGVLQAVPSEKGTEIILESTANGIGNYFHEQWQLAESGASDFLPIFVPWFWLPDYRRQIDYDLQPLEDEVELINLYNLDAHQLVWRRYKIQELSAAGGNGQKAFQQEYPMNAVEAFVSSGEDTLIDPSLVMRARKAKCEAYGPLIIGCDPARFGDDRTSIIRRRGRVAYGLKSYLKKDTMEVAGILHKIILDENPDQVCVDVGGLGAGVVDRLNELGHGDIVIAVNAGSSALDQDAYSNKRAEMWGECNKWLRQIPVQIPDEDSLHADLTSVKYKYDSLSRLVIEPKDQMKKRGLRSPDEAESLIQTFAEPVESGSTNKQQSESIANQIMSGSNRLQRLRSGR